MVITLLSDFGDMYPASMKGVILVISPSEIIVDISHHVPCHDIHAGAFMLMACSRYFPSGTVHIAVVDPGVGTIRRAIAVMAGHGAHYFIGPDNGLLIPAARSIGEFEVFTSRTNDLWYKYNKVEFGQGDYPVFRRIRSNGKEDLRTNAKS